MCLHIPYLRGILGMQIKSDEERISMLVSDSLKSKMEADKVLATQLDRFSKN